MYIEVFQFLHSTSQLQNSLLTHRRQFKMYQIISIFVLCLFALSEAKITTCDSPAGTVNVTDITIPGCRLDDEFCIFKRDTNVSIAFNVTINKPVELVKTAVHASVWFSPFPIPFSVPNSEFCIAPTTTSSCPLSSNGTTFRYSATLPIKGNYPKVSVGVKWELQNKDGEDIACLWINAKIK